jgi:hypothetical protein
LRIGALVHVAGAFRFPLFETVVVGERRAVEGVLEVGLGMSATEEMLARADLAQGIERLAVVRKVDAGEQGPS